MGLIRRALNLGTAGAVRSESKKQRCARTAAALREHREIIVITRREIEDLSDTDELVLLHKKKRAQLAVSGTIFEQ